MEYLANFKGSIKVKIVFNPLSIKHTNPWQVINNSICSLSATLPTESRPPGSGVEKRSGRGGGGGGGVPCDRVLFLGPSEPETCQGGLLKCI